MSNERRLQPVIVLQRDRWGHAERLGYVMTRSKAKAIIIAKPIASDFTLLNQIAHSHNNFFKTGVPSIVLLSFVVVL